MSTSSTIANTLPTEDNGQQLSSENSGVDPRKYGYPTVNSAIRHMDPFQLPFYWFYNRDLGRLGPKEYWARNKEFKNAPLEFVEARPA